MSAKDLLAASVPISAAQLSGLQQTLGDPSAQQLAWLSGYFWALSHQASTPALSVPFGSQAPAISTATQTPAPVITLISASQTGNAKRVAEGLRDALQTEGWQVNYLKAADVKLKSLAQVQILIVIAATYGEGEPPEEAVELHKFLYGKKAPDLSAAQFAVFGLGDSSYEKFCQTGKDFDSRLAELGARRLLARVDADVDYQAAVDLWSATLVAELAPQLAVASSVISTSVAETAHVPVSPNKQQHYSKDAPCTVQLAAQQKITGRFSEKDVRHIEIDLAESGLTYQAGDALGVWFSNDPLLVDELLGYVSLQGSETVSVDTHLDLSLREALIHHYEITQNAPSVVDAYAGFSGAEHLQILTGDKAALRHYAQQHSLIAMLQQAPSPLSAEQLLGMLRRLTPRLYSIASAQDEVGDEVHLTVGVVRYEEHAQIRSGGASGFLADRLQIGDALRVFVEPNDNFRLPNDPETPVVMIGPGTGIAPFRAFMQQREASGAEGKNWLFFGNPHFTDDFLYQVEWQKWVKSGLVTQISLAWSRDQAHKVYVQDKIREQGAQLWQWLQQGAHLYVCGDANRMAHDVQRALLEVISQYGHYSAEQAEEYLSELRQTKRYQRDVY
ncbi:MAG: NADPH-dependent assimilatory sulfite reductase flavoprotein subunit [Plesiomonas sp.]